MDLSPLFDMDILVSIRPEYADQILEGKKTVELRRRFPGPEITGSKVLIYSSSPTCAIVGIAEIKDIKHLPLSQLWKDHGLAACISKQKFDTYFDGVNRGYAILLKNLESLTDMVSIEDMRERHGIAPPQSYRYLSKDRTTRLVNDRLQVSNRHQRRHRA